MTELKEEKPLSIAVPTAEILKQAIQCFVEEAKRKGDKSCLSCSIC
jgi:hypothetical protein